MVESGDVEERLQHGGAGLACLQFGEALAQQVGTVLRLLNAATGTFEPVTGELADIEPLRPTITNAVEVGWKGALGQSMVFDVSWYRTRRESFRGPLAIATPNAFLDPDDLTAYFGQFTVDRTLVWPNGADFAPEFLHERVSAACRRAGRR